MPAGAQGRGVSTLFTFPGQGAQRAGMLHELPHDTIVRDAIDEACDTLGLDVLDLDSEAALRSTVASQLCLLVAGVATARHLISRAGLPPAVAGFSVGAYPAAVTASVLSYRDALTAVDSRARLMEAAHPSGFGMMAILGLEQAALQELIAQVHAPHTPAYLANINAPTQLVVAGAEPALKRLSELARERGAHGTKTIAISVPSHCELLAEPAARLAQAMSAMNVSAPRLRYYSASHGRELRDPRRIRTTWRATWPCQCTGTRPPCWPKNAARASSSRCRPATYSPSLRQRRYRTRWPSPLQTHAATQSPLL